MDIFSVLGEGPIDYINDKVDEPEKIIGINFTN